MKGSGGKRRKAEEIGESAELATHRTGLVGPSLGDRNGNRRGLAGSRGLPTRVGVNWREVSLEAPRLVEASG